MKSWRGVLGAVLAAAVLAAGGVLWLRGGDGSRAGLFPSLPGATDGASVPIEGTSSAFSPEVAVPVGAAPVREGTFTFWIEADGRARARRRTTLRARVSGSVRRVFVREGEFVRAGDLVASLDAGSRRLEVEHARARYETARAEFRATERSAAGLDLSEEERGERRRNARIRSGLLEADAELRRAQRRLAGTVLEAPFSGRIGDLAVRRGSRLRPGDSVATLLDLSRVEVVADVLQTRIASVERGRPARVRFTALPRESFSGTVVSINPLVDPRSNSVRVRIRLQNPEERVLPGMHARAEIAGRRYPNRVFVPRRAIVERDRRQVVFTVAFADSSRTTARAEWRYVATGLENDRFVEIVPGKDTRILEPGELVLVDGHTTLAHDARIRVQDRSGLAAESRSP